MFQPYNKYNDIPMAPDMLYHKPIQKPTLDIEEHIAESVTTEAKVSDIESYKQDITNQKNQIFSKMQTMNTAMSSIPVPQAPDKDSDEYKKEDGSFDEDKYNKDYESYEKKLANYNQNINKIKEELEKLAKESEKLDNILAQLESLEGTEVPPELKASVKEAITKNNNNKIVKSSDITVNNMEVQSYITKFRGEKDALAEQAEGLNAEIETLMSVGEPDFKNYINSDGTINVDGFKAAVKEFNNAQERILELVKQLEELKERDEWLESILSTLYTATSVKDFKDAIVNQESRKSDNLDGGNDYEVGVLANVNQRIEQTQKNIESTAAELKSTSERLNELNSQVSPLIDEFKNAFDNAPKLDDFVEGDTPNVEAYNSAVEKYNQEQENRLKEIEKLLTEIAKLETLYDSLTQALESFKTELEEEVRERKEKITAFNEGLQNTEFKSFEELEAFVKNSEFAQDVVIEKESESDGKTTYRVSGANAGIDAVSVTIANKKEDSDDKVAIAVNSILKTIQGGTYQALNALKEFAKDGVDVSVYASGDKYVVNVSYGAGNINETIELDIEENTTSFLKGSGFIDENTSSVVARSRGSVAASRGMSIISDYYQGDGVVSDVQITEGSEETTVSFNTANKDGSTSTVTITVNQGGLSSYNETIFDQGHPVRRIAVEDSTFTDFTYVYDGNGNGANMVPTDTIPNNPPVENPEDVTDLSYLGFEQDDDIPKTDNNNNKLKYEDWKKENHYTNDAVAQLAYYYYLNSDNTPASDNTSTAGDNNKLSYEEWIKDKHFTNPADAQLAYEAYRTTPDTQQPDNPPAGDNNKLSYEEWIKDKHFTNPADARLAYEAYRTTPDTPQPNTTGNTDNNIITVTDANGRVTCKQTRDSSGNVISQTEYEYDDYGNIIREVTVKNDKIVKDFTYIYDGNGNVANVVPTNTLPNNPPAGNNPTPVGDNPSPTGDDKPKSTEGGTQVEKPLFFNEWSEIYGENYKSAKEAADAYGKYLKKLEEAGVKIGRDEEGNPYYDVPTENGHIKTTFKNGSTINDEYDKDDNHTKQTEEKDGKTIVKEYENGDVTKCTQKDSDGTTHIWEYEADGKTVKTYTEQYSDGTVYINGEKQDKLVYIDDDGNEITKTSNGSTKIVTTVRPDHTTKEEYTNPSGEITTVEKDSDGKIISETIVTPLPGGIQETKVSYLSGSNQGEKITITSNDKGETKITYTDGPKKGQTVIITDNGDGETKTQYIGGEYDGQTVYSTELPGCTQVVVEKDGKKLSVSHKTQQKNGSVTVTVTDYYDENGNVNKKTEHQQTSDGNSSIGEYAKVDGKMVLQTTKNYDKSGKQTSETNYQYDPVTGKQVSRITTGTENGQNVVVKVNADGSKVKTVEDPSTGTSTITTTNKDGSSFTTKCDKDGKPIETIIDDGKGQKLSYDVNKYMNSDGTYKSQQIVDFWNNYNQVVSFTNTQEINAFINFYYYASSGNCKWETWYSTVQSGNFDTKYWAKQKQYSPNYNTGRTGNNSGSSSDNWTGSYTSTGTDSNGNPYWTNGNGNTTNVDPLSGINWGHGVQMPSGSIFGGGYENGMFGNNNWRHSGGGGGGGHY